jgi:hypothetical protein
MAQRTQEHGAGDLVSPQDAPVALYHGTNFISAAAIVKCGRFEAEDPVDGEELGAVVCFTSDEEMGRNFAIEFVRINSDHPVGAVFQLHGSKIAQTQELYPYHAETAGVFEFEYRATGDIPVKDIVVSVNLVGEVDLLDLDRFIDDAWEGMPYHQRGWFGSLGAFYLAVEKLMNLANRPRVAEESDEDENEY